jgi:tetratricopeptide (TPR) repeat protein
MLVCNNLGVVYEYLGDYERAKELYEKAFNISPEEDIYQNLEGLIKEMDKEITISNEKELCNSKNIAYKTVELKKKIPAKLDISNITKVYTIVFTHNNYDVKKIADKVVDIFEDNVIEQTAFYVLEDEEVARIIDTEDIPYSILDNERAIVELCNDISIQGLFVFDFIEFKDERIKGISHESYYSEGERRYIYYEVPFITRQIMLKMKIYLFDAATGKILWCNKYEVSNTKDYHTDDEEDIPLCDPEIFKVFFTRPAYDFIAATKPQYKYSTRKILVRKRR